MLAYHPISAITHGLALNITVQSYEKALDFGLVACARAVPDLDGLIDALAAEYDELKALAAARLALTPSRKRKPATRTRSKA